MRKKVITFDLDGTLADSKSPIEDRMSDLLTQLLGKFHVCIMSGGRFEQFQLQLLSNLKADPTLLEKLHLMPTCGTRYYLYNVAKSDWKQVYAEDFTESEKQKIIDALNKGIDECGLREKETWGEVIEDRGSQITFSALGQDVVAKFGSEGVSMKERWDPDVKKRRKLRDHVAGLIPEFEVRVGGISSVDITKPGIDKAYGMQKLIDMLGISKEEVLFIGDRLEEGGNDYPVKAMGVDSIQISHWQETAIAIEAVIHTA